MLTICLRHHHSDKILITDPKWLNRDIKQATQVKYKLFFEKRSQKPIKNRFEKQKQFNAASRKVKKLVFLSILEYEEKIIKNCKNNLKILYSYINKQKKNKGNIRSLRRESGELTIDFAEIANLLNDQFYSVFSLSHLLTASHLLLKKLHLPHSVAFQTITNHKQIQTSWY